MLAQQKELETLHWDLADLDPNDPRMDSLLQRQGELQHALEESGVFNMQPRIERVLFGLGFKSQDLARPVNQFSGGWVMRLLLAKLLLQQPALLLLDEPTKPSGPGFPDLAGGFPPAVSGCHYADFP